ncbi:uncharacterized protein LOC128216602 isoform X2 [Mya arenaria]|uniref:uncharacterized protein LOC128216602 isoform X2 n=1 Tax=Mya arenaria TaxID=6604 RepID=UPI0022E8AB50|nr:uncharacterized protein LOC128216602 isoform X2 [Mya arenaria]
MTRLIISICALILVAGKGMSEQIDSCNNHATYNGCNNDCSQSRPRIDGDDFFFNCSIGTKKDVEMFKTTNKDIFNQRRKEKFDAPELTGIGTFWISDERTSPSLTLELTFRLPKAFFNGGRFEYPKAVLLNFTSVEGGNWSDKFYHDCPRERIFAFHRYQPTFEYDANNPRSITYSCLYGLDFKLLKGVYILTFTTVEGRSRTYQVTVPVRFQSSKVWKPIIATSLDNDSGNLSVIVEKQPTALQHLIYDLNLCNQDDICTQQKPKSMSGNITRFQITNGVYIVKVIIHGCPQNYRCDEEVSYKINALQLPLTKAQEDWKKLAAMITGCLAGIALLLLIAYCIRRNLPYQQKFEHQNDARGVIIHPYIQLSRCTVRHHVVVNKLHAFLSACVDCDLLPDESLRKVKDEKRADSIFKGLKFAIVICLDEISNDPTFSLLLKAALKRRQNNNDIFIVPVTFSYIQSSIQPEGLAQFQCLKLMDSSLGLYKKIHPNLSEDALSVFASKLISSQEGTELVDDINSGIPHIPRNLHAENNHFGQSSNTSPTKIDPRNNNMSEKEISAKEIMGELSMFNDKSSYVSDHISKQPDVRLKVSSKKTRTRDMSLLFEDDHVPSVSENEEDDEKSFKVRRCVEFVKSQQEITDSERMPLMHHQQAGIMKVGVGVYEDNKEHPLDTFQRYNQDGESESDFNQYQCSPTSNETPNKLCPRSLYEHETRPDFLAPREFHQDSAYDLNHQLPFINGRHQINVHSPSPRNAHRNFQLQTPAQRECHHQSLGHRGLNHHVPQSSFRFVSPMPDDYNDEYLDDTHHNEPYDNLNEPQSQQIEDVRFSAVDNYNPLLNRQTKEEIANVKAKSASVPRGIHEASDDPWIPPSDICKESTTFDKSEDVLDMLLEFNKKSEKQ